MQEPAPLLEAPASVEPQAELGKGNGTEKERSSHSNRLLLLVHKVLVDSKSSAGSYFFFCPKSKSDAQALTKDYQQKARLKKQ